MPTKFEIRSEGATVILDQKIDNHVFAYFTKNEPWLPPVLSRYGVCRMNIRMYKNEPGVTFMEFPTIGCDAHPNFETKPWGKLGIVRGPNLDVILNHEAPPEVPEAPNTNGELDDETIPTTFRGRIAKLRAERDTVEVKPEPKALPPADLMLVVEDAGSKELFTTFPPLTFEAFGRHHLLIQMPEDRSSPPKISFTKPYAMVGAEQTMVRASAPPE